MITALLSLSMILEHLQPKVITTPPKYRHYSSRTDYRNFNNYLAIAFKEGSAYKSLPEKEIAALKEIVYKESRFNRHERTSRSTSYGLYGFLNSTWSGIRMKKSSDPVKQTIAALRYIKNRYGLPSKALKHHKKHNWY